MQREVECLENLSCNDEALLPSRCWQKTLFDGFSNVGAEKQRISIIPLGAAEFNLNLNFETLVFTCTHFCAICCHFSERTSSETPRRD